MTCALYDHGLDWTAPVSEMVGANGHIRIFHFTLYEFALSNIFLISFSIYSSTYKLMKLLNTKTQAIITHAKGKSKAEIVVASCTIRVTQTGKRIKL